MKDFGRSDDPRVQAQLDRLSALSVPQGRLGLDTVRALLDRLGDPHLRLPPVFHVAGTNGKGSVCAFLRAMMEAEGKRVHVTTSPHLVRYNERIRVAGELISDGRLADLLAEVLDAGDDLSPSFFEVTIAAAFTEFARVPADACVVEVGLGGRFDATNVLPSPAACGIAALGIDHERFLLAAEEGVPQAPLARIAFEKAGIAKPGSPLCVLGPRMSAAQVILEVAEQRGAPLYMEGVDWLVHPGESSFHFIDGSRQIALPLPGLPGRHQVANAALAAAMLVYQDAVEVSEEAMAAGIAGTTWPARLQWLGDGPLTRRLPENRVLLDGGHNPDAAGVLAEYLGTLGQTVHAVLGMIAGKDAAGFLKILGPRLASLTAIPVPGHDTIPPAELARLAHAAGVEDARIADGLETALGRIAEIAAPGRPILIGGSLYLAGEVLRLNAEFPG